MIRIGVMFIRVLFRGGVWVVMVEINKRQDNKRNMMSVSLLLEMSTKNRIFNSNDYP